MMQDDTSLQVNKKSELTYSGCANPSARQSVARNVLEGAVVPSA